MMIKACAGILMMIFAVAYYIWGTFFAFYGREGSATTWFDKFCNHLNKGRGRVVLWILTILNFAVSLCFQSLSVEFSDYMFIFGICLVMLFFDLVTLPLMAIVLSYFVEGARLAFPGLIEKMRLFALENPWTLLFVLAFFVGMFFFTMYRYKG